IGRWYWLQAPDYQLDRWFPVRRWRVLPIDDARGDLRRAQTPRLDQRHYFGKERCRVGPSGEEADAERVEAAERHRHVRPGVEAHALQASFRPGGADGVAQAVRRQPCVDDDWVPALRLVEVGPNRPSTETLGERQRFGVVAGVVDASCAERKRGLRRVQRDA